MRKAYTAAYDRRLRHPAWVCVLQCFPLVWYEPHALVLRRPNTSPSRRWVNQRLRRPRKMKQATGRDQALPKTSRCLACSARNSRITSRADMIADTCRWFQRFDACVAEATTLLGRVPAADAKLSQDAMNETFLLSNIAPQVGAGFNRHCTPPSLPHHSYLVVTFCQTGPMSKTGVDGSQSPSPTSTSLPSPSTCRTRTPTANGASYVHRPSVPYCPESLMSPSMRVQKELRSHWFAAQHRRPDPLCKSRARIATVLALDARRARNIYRRVRPSECHHPGRGTAREFCHARYVPVRSSFFFFLWMDRSSLLLAVFDTPITDTSFTLRMQSTQSSALRVSRSSRMRSRVRPSIFARRPSAR